MLEWLKRHAWKACIRQKRIGGSNPPLSAKSDVTSCYQRVTSLFCFALINICATLADSFHLSQLADLPIFSEWPHLTTRKKSTERMQSLLHLSLAFSLGWTLKYIDWNLHLYWLLSAFSLGWTRKQVGCREMRRCPCALFQMANEE